MKKTITVKVKEENRRLDRFLADSFSSFSRADFQKLIRKGTVEVGGKKAKPSEVLKFGDKISIDFPDSMDDIPLLPQKIDFEIIFENQEVIVLNKPAGLVVHPAAGNKDWTLANALVQLRPEIKMAIADKNDKFAASRPGMVHRLDKDTSGVMIAAKNPDSLQFLSNEIKNRKAVKIYWSLSFGWPKTETGHLVNTLGRSRRNRKKIGEVVKKGKDAVSDYKVLKYLETEAGEKLSLIEWNIKTGRTHQIRVQSNIFGHPVIGDQIYGNKNSQKLSKLVGAKRQMLHAKELKIRLPGEKKPFLFTASLVPDFSELLNSLKLSA